MAPVTAYFILASARGVALVATCERGRAFRLMLTVRCCARAGKCRARAIVRTDRMVGVP